MNISEWAAALHHQVVANGQPERLLYLYVDRSVLAEASGQSDEAAVRDFSNAYRADMGAEPFRRQWQSMLAWRQEGWNGNCPYLPALALTVLAVTEDPLGASHGVYRRLNSLLGLPAEAQQPPGYSDQVPAMWAAWNEWLKGPGSRYGKPSARTHPHWTYQGWARSQGLIRYRDRLQIEDFVAGVRLPASRDLPWPSVLAATLTDQFQTWLRYRGQNGERLLSLMDDEAAREIVCDVVADEAGRWARLGSRARQPATGSLQALYLYDAWDAELKAVLPVTDRLREHPVTVGEEDISLSDFDTHLALPTPATPAQMLSRGAAWTLRPGLRARIAPSSAVVLSDDPVLGGLVQVRGRVAAASYTLLCRNDLLGEVRNALAAQAPLTVEPAGHQLPDWSWVRGVSPAPDSNELRALGLGSLATTAVGVTTIDVTGGLRLDGNTYLTGGEPDVVTPEANIVTLDGEPLPSPAHDTPGPSRYALADLILDPGAHEVSGTDGTTIRFATTTHRRETPQASNYAHDPLDSVVAGLRPGPHRFPQLEGTAAARPVAPDGPAPLVCGALVGPQPLDTPADPLARLELLRSRVLPGRHALVLREDGSMVEVYPKTETWLSEIHLSPGTVDVLRATRTMIPRPAYFLELAPRLHSCTAVEIPETTPLLPGKVEQRCADELLGAVVSGTWVTGSTTSFSRDRRQQILSRSMLRRPQSSPQPRGPAAIPAPPRARADVTAETVDDNPFDDVVTWLSERESGSASITDFAQTWAWSCRRRGQGAQGERHGIALARLADLGFVETDWSRARVHIAAPTAVEIPAAGGLLLLTGARPIRLLERLEDDNDSDPDVARAAQLWEVHRRTQTESDGAPASPTAVYLEIDTAQPEHVTAGLHALGVHLTSGPSRRLLAALPDQSQLANTGLSLTVSPGRDFQRRRSGASAVGHWETASSDQPAGLYRYRLARGDQYAWRATPDSPLLAVTRAAGLWLDDSQHPEGERHHRRLVYWPGSQSLMVIKDLSLPWAIRRALTLRTGLIPTLNQPQGHSMPQAGTHLVFRNIDSTTADTLGRLLGREPSLL